MRPPPPQRQQALLPPPPAHSLPKSRTHSLPKSKAPLIVFLNPGLQAPPPLILFLNPGLPRLEAPPPRYPTGLDERGSLPRIATLQLSQLSASACLRLFTSLTRSLSSEPLKTQTILHQACLRWPNNTVGLTWHGDVVETINLATP